MDYHLRNFAVRLILGYRPDGIRGLWRYCMRAFIAIVIFHMALTSCGVVLH